MSKSGFALTELIVVMGITLTLLAIGTFAFIKPQQKTNLDAVVNLLITDIKAEQTKAMSGDINSNYTIHFENDKYTVNNFDINLDEQIRIIDITFQNRDLVFQKGSGEVNFLLNQNSFKIINTSSNETIQININKYGSIQKN